MNKVILIGRLTKDPEVRSTQNNTSVASFTLAVDRKYNKQETDFINIVAWSKTAELIGRYVFKGSKVAIEGNIQTRNYEKDGRKIYITEVIAENIEFLDNKNTDIRQEQEYEDTGGLPFEL